MTDATGDFYGVPEFFVNCVSTECAGNGNIRVFNYAKRGGILVPQFTVVSAAADLLISARRVDEAAHHVFNFAQFVEGLTAH